MLSALFSGFSRSAWKPALGALRHRKQQSARYFRLVGLFAELLTLFLYHDKVAFEGTLYCYFVEGIMITTDQIVPVSDFRKYQSAVMKKVQAGPLYLSQRGYTAAVMLSNHLFDSLLKQLEDKDDLIDALKAEIALLKGEERAEPVDIAELEGMIDGS